jgi:small subunit ribosomal protein S6
LLNILGVDELLARLISGLQLVVSSYYPQGELYMRFYETVFIARQDVTANQVESLAQQYTAVINDHGGEVSKTEFCGLRSLAYPIKKNKKGHYVLLNIAVESNGIKEMERQMHLNEDVLRYLTVRVDMLDKAPSAMMQNRNYREDQRNTSYDDLDSEG